MKRSVPITLAVISILTSCAGSLDVKNALATINADEIRKYTSEISSDSFMGREPFTKGEERTVLYLSKALSDIGFDPAFNGSYCQEVPMIQITSRTLGTVTFNTSGKILSFNSPDDIAIVSPLQQELTEVTKMPVVFCGFGIVAPEYGWNDYKDIDVKGKCVIVLVNDPGLYTGDSTLFKGRTMTYYGRWTYKFEEAARQGAAAILIIHETLGAGYDYSIQRSSSVSPKLYMLKTDKPEKQCHITGWLNDKAAERLFGTLGYSVDSLRIAACRKDFKGFDLKTEISAKITNKFRIDRSMNVAGILPGRKIPDEAVVITAHWDHFGIGEKVDGDSIYNGTVDNGTSMAWALEIGKAFSSLDTRPERSVIILFPTAEEQGLLGTDYFVSHSPIETKKIAACFNNDLMLPIGRMKDIMVTGYGQSDLEDMLAVVAKKQDRYLQPDPRPEMGMYFRSDHFPFAKAGIPSLFVRGNCDSREHGKEWAAEQENEFLKNSYHKPADNYYPEMNFDGIAEDARAVFEVAFKVVTSDIYPKWKSTSEFARLRMPALK
jgi:Zn-dependent M28 family amino/carboxypeptidase